MALSQTLSECHFPLRVAGRVAPKRVAPYTISVGTSSSIFYHIIHAVIGVFLPFGPDKVMFVSNISDTTTPSLPPTP